MSLASNNTSHKIDPLNGDNYATWRCRLEWILDDQDLWDITIGIEAEPTSMDPNNITAAERQAIANWKEKTRRREKRFVYVYLMNISFTLTNSWGATLSGLDCKASLNPKEQSE